MKTLRAVSVLCSHQGSVDVIAMRVLGSGSTGNCTLMRVGGRLVMIDAGLGPRTVARRLGPGGAAELENLQAVLLTHLDRDHFNPAWFVTLLKHRVTIYCHRKHLYGLYRHAPTTRQGIDARVLHREGLLRPFSDQPFNLHGFNGTAAPPANGVHGDYPSHGDGVRVQPLPLLHDRSGVFAFEVRVGPGDRPTRLGYATDLGGVPGRLIEAFRDVDLLAIESNYDPPMQLDSNRPATLKRRIMGGRGHLSNEQALHAVRQIVRASTRPPDHIVLLHLSRHCNCPSIIRRLYGSHPDIAQRLCLTHHREPTDWLSARNDGRTAPPPVQRYRQMRMF